MLIRIQSKAVKKVHNFPMFSRNIAYHQIGKFKFPIIELVIRFTGFKNSPIWITLFKLSLRSLVLFSYRWSPFGEGGITRQFSLIKIGSYNAFI